jgi:hypothetical protein
MMGPQGVGDVLTSLPGIREVILCGTREKTRILDPRDTIGWDQQMLRNAPGIADNGNPFVEINEDARRPLYLVQMVRHALPINDPQ